MRKLKIVQLACYQGNVGDNANISGTRVLLNQNFEYDIEYTDLDIMDYIWKFKRFDSRFAEVANQHDLMIIGGGGFFELTNDRSCTGTPLDISLEVLDQINVPLVFYALGIDTGKSITSERVNKFRLFLDRLLASDKILVSVRNDGAIDNVRALLGEEYASRIYEVPDGGFFTTIGDYFHPELPAAGRRIGINLAGDMPDTRFSPAERGVIGRVRKRLGKRPLEAGQKTRNISVEEFVAGLASLLDGYLSRHDDTGIVLIPHIYKDLNIIAGLMSRLPSHVNRRRVTVAPYLHGTGAQEYIFDLYRKCDLILGMRFHANVCSIGLKVPTVGLITYPQIENLYRRLGLSGNAVRVNVAGFEKDLLALIEESLSTGESLRRKFAEIRGNLLKEVNAFHALIVKSLLLG